jgi:hypothetical protein
MWDVRRAGAVASLDRHRTEAAALDDGGREEEKSVSFGTAGSSRSGREGGGGGGEGRRVYEGTGVGGHRMFVPEVEQSGYSCAHDGSVTGIASTPDGLFWVTAGTDDRVRLWDARTHRRAFLCFFLSLFLSSSAA